MAFCGIGSELKYGKACDKNDWEADIFMQKLEMKPFGWSHIHRQPHNRGMLLIGWVVVVINLPFSVFIVPSQLKHYSNVRCGVSGSFME